MIRGWFVRLLICLGRIMTWWWHQAAPRERRLPAGTVEWPSTTVEAGRYSLAGRPINTTNIPNGGGEFTRARLVSVLASYLWSRYRVKSCGCGLGWWGHGPPGKIDQRCGCRTAALQIVSRQRAWLPHQRSAHQKVNNGGGLMMLRHEQRSRGRDRHSELVC